ncbi:MAG: hypothetical protein JST26_03270 [Bacteroidetes bacterium]|nr:hypothetical protein [Bacteroidota bacterium]
MKILALIIGIALGGWGMYLYYPKLHIKDPTRAAITDASVKSIDGVYIFIESDPQAGYESLGKISQDNMLETAGSLSDIAQDKDKNVVEKILDGANELRENLSFDKRLHAYVKTAKEKDNSVQGLLFSHAGLEEAEMIRFSK